MLYSVLPKSSLHVIDCFYGESVAINMNYDHDTGFRTGVSERENHSDKMKKYISEYVLGSNIVHINQGIPEQQIPKTVVELQAKLAIIGNTKGDGLLSRAFGDTTQLLTDCLVCDILIMKTA